MKQSPIGRSTVLAGTRDGPTNRVVESESAVERILAALEDDDCREILAAVTADELTASELAERCDLPLSTAYNKLGRLTEASLIAEHTRMRADGNHVSEYVRAVEDVRVSMGADGLALEVTDRDGVASNMPPRFARAGD